MATIYICKCGRQVRKNTSADNTGNRDTAGCRGCPYLLPWGPTQWDATRHAMVTDVKGYECRMSPSLDYATYYQGGGEDKCVLHIYSLDYDFLDRVTAWATKQFPDKEISCSFDRSKIRATEFIGGLYGMSVYPMQNKKGMAAKAALIERFFGPDKHRLDMTPEEEKAHILAAIEAGKAQAQKKEDKTLMYKDPVTGWLYRVSPNPINDKGVYELEYLDQQNSTIWKPDVYWNTNAVYRDREHLQEALDNRARRDGWESVEKVPVENPTDAAPVSPVDAGAAMQSLSDAEPVSLAADECTENPTSSAAATAAAEETVAAPEPSDSASMTAAPVAKTSEPAGVASENVLAGADGSTAFDYSGLDDQTVADLHLAEREYSSGKKMAEMGLRRMADAVAIAHDALCGAVVHMVDNSKHGNRGEDTFRCWCESIGVGKTTAYKMLQVSKLMEDSSPREQKVLEELSPSLLYAAAKPSAPAELVQAVKDGEITTHKQYQEALAEIKARDAKIQELLEMSEGADRRADAADARAKKAEQERDAARDAQANLSAMANKFSKQRDAAEQRVEDAEHRAEEAERRARAAEEDAAGWKQAGLEMQELVDQRDERIRELESGITVEAAAVDQEEIERRANELSEPLLKIINQKDEQIERMASGNTVAVQASVLEQYLENMKTSLLGNARRAEPAFCDVGALDSLAQALRAFADEIDGLFEEGEENEE